MKTYLKKTTAKILSLFAVLCVFCFSTFGQSTTYDSRLKGIDTMVDRVLRDWHVVGCAVAVVEKGKLIYAKGFGYRDLEHKLPVTPNTVFSIASCTKAFTGQLIGTLVTDSKLDINKPVHSFFPELVFYNDLLTNNVTVKDMLAHRTGLPRHDWMGHYKTPLPIDSIVYRIRYLEPSAGFREELKYNNLMYTVLGALVQKLTGKTWEDYMKEKILNPLEMVNTSCLISDLEKSSEYSLGYAFNGEKFIEGVSDHSGANPAGSMNASVNDMAKWLITLINEGKYNGQQVLSAKFIREATSPQMSAPSHPRPGTPVYPDCYFGDYGYGWNIASYRGHYQVTHGGDLPYYSSMTSFYPTDSLGIVVLVNKFNATIAEIITCGIADKLLSLPYKNWNDLILALQPKSQPKNNNAQPQKKQEPIPLTRPFTDYTGSYAHPAYGNIIIYNEKDTLRADYNGYRIRFDHINKDTFRAAVPGNRLVFHENANGRVFSISGALEPEVADITFLKKKDD